MFEREKSASRALADESSIRKILKVSFAVDISELSGCVRGGARLTGCVNSSRCALSCSALIYGTNGSLSVLSCVLCALQIR